MEIIWKRSNVNPLEGEALLLIGPFTNIRANVLQPSLSFPSHASNGIYARSQEAFCQNPCAISTRNLCSGFNIKKQVAIAYSVDRHNCWFGAS